MSSRDLPRFPNSPQWQLFTHQPCFGGAGGRMTTKSVWGSLCTSGAPLGMWRVPGRHLRQAAPISRPAKMWLCAWVPHALNPAALQQTGL